MLFLYILLSTAYSYLYVYPLNRRNIKSRNLKLLVVLVQRQFLGKYILCFILFCSVLFCSLFYILSIASFSVINYNHCYSFLSIIVGDPFSDEKINTLRKRSDLDSKTFFFFDRDNVTES